MTNLLALMEWAVRNRIPFSVEYPEYLSMNTVTEFAGPVIPTTRTFDKAELVIIKSKKVTP